MAYSIITSDVSRFFSSSAARRIVASLRQTMLRRLTSGDMLTVSAFEKGAVVSAMLYEADGLTDFFTEGEVSKWGAYIQVALTIGVMLYLSPLLTAITLPIVPVVFLVFGALKKGIKNVSSRLISSRKGLNATLYEILASLLPIRANSIGGVYEGRFEASLASLQSSDQKLRLYNVFYSLASWTMIMVPYQALMYGVAGGMYLKLGVPTIGLMLTFANYANSMLGPLQTIANYKRMTAHAQNCHQSISRILNVEEEASGKEAVRLTEGLPTIETKGLAFRYGEEEALLHYGDLCFSNDGINVITGKSGAGEYPLGSGSGL